MQRTRVRSAKALKKAFLSKVLEALLITKASEHKSDIWLDIYLD